MAKLSIALMHYPVFNKDKKVVASSITNLDIHDIARVSKCYNLTNYYILHPQQEQLMYVSRLLDHWFVGTGIDWNIKRKKALKLIELVETFEQIISHIQSQHSSDVELKIILTSAQGAEKTTKFRELRDELVNSKENIHYLMLFGTAHGLDFSSIKSPYICLEPIQGLGEEDYRHLSVRSAITICLDRLLGSW